MPARKNMSIKAATKPATKPAGKAAGKKSDKKGGKLKKLLKPGKLARAAKKRRKGKK